MSQKKLSIIGLLIGTVIGAIAGVAFPETRFEPIFIGVITICGGITGLLIGFASSRLDRTAVILGDHVEDESR